MGYNRKIFQKKVKNRNPYAKELAEEKYHQRIKESDKVYTRKKVKLKDVYEYEDSAD